MGGLEDVEDACNEKHRWLSSIDVARARVQTADP
jgi:hypothetical protein